MITNVPRTGASSGQQRTRVLTGVQALRYAPTPLRSAMALTLAPRTLVRFGMDDDARSFASSTMAPWCVSIEHVWTDQGRPPRVVRLDLAPDHATCRPDARVVVPNNVAARPACRRDNDLRRPCPEAHRGGAIDPSFPAALTHQAAGKGKIARCARVAVAALCAATETRGPDGQRAYTTVAGKDAGGHLASAGAPGGVPRGSPRPRR